MNTYCHEKVFIINSVKKPGYRIQNCIYSVYADFAFKKY